MSECLECLVIHVCEHVCVSVPVIRLPQAAQAFQESWSEMMDWIEGQRETLEAMAPPDEDATVLQEQIEENKVHVCVYIHVKLLLVYDDEQCTTTTLLLYLYARICMQSSFSILHGKYLILILLKFCTVECTYCRI